MAESSVIEQLVIHLHVNDDNKASWLVRGRDGALLTQPQKSSLQDIALQAEGKEVLVLIPGSKALLLTADLPPMNTAKCQQAVSYALEDQLAADIEKLHFAIAAHRSSEGMDVAVINEQYLVHCLEKLSEAGLSPDVVLPETLSLPVQDEIWHVYATCSRSLCRQGAFRGFVADNANLALLLNAKLNEVPHPEKIILHNFNSDLDLQALSSSVPVPVEDASCAEKDFFKEMAKNVDTKNAINLLQGAYRVETKITGIQRWQIASLGLAGLWVLASFSGLLFQHHVLTANNDGLNQAIEKIYKQNFPHAQSVVAPRFRFQEKLKALSAISSRNAYLHTLAQSGSVLKQFDRLRLNNLTFKEHALSLDVSAPDFDYLNQALSALKKQGLTAKQLNARSSGQHVMAVFKLS